MNKFNLSNIPKRYRQNGNFNFWIPLILESKKLLPNKKKKVLDFGCGDGAFLQLFAYTDKLKNGLGLELDKELIKRANKQNSNSSIKYKTYGYSLKKNYFDVAFSQEVIYTIKDLDIHAKEIFDSLKQGAYYFATIGSHIENPLWSKRRQLIRDEENYYAYDYSIDEIADIFHKAGFQVGIKRLPIEYPIIYDPKTTKDFSNSLSELVQTSYENKMIFSFWKPFE